MPRTYGFWRFETKGNSSTDKVSEQTICAWKNDIVRF